MKTPENDPNVLQVTKAELHYWPACPCRACEEERTRRDRSSPTDSRLRSISVDMAHLLGYIPTRCQEGSLARRMAIEALPPK